jgi:hypothetical protein
VIAVRQYFHTGLLHFFWLVSADSVVVDCIKESESVSEAIFTMKASYEETKNKD